jgi:nicotinate-nucleotide pyrophosphorylase
MALNNNEIDGVLKAFLREDLSERGDVTTLSTIDSSITAEASFLAKDDGIIAGISVADRVFALVRFFLFFRSVVDGSHSLSDRLTRI